MNAPLNFTTPSLDLVRALHQVMRSMQPNTELLIYRDDDAPPKLEISHADGTTEIIDLDVPAGESVQIDVAFESGSHADWHCVDVALPDALTDVLLFQVLPGFSEEEGNTLIRIGFMRVDGAFFATYGSNIDGSEELLETVTHWAPLPAEPVQVQP